MPRYFCIQDENGDAITGASPAFLSAFDSATLAATTLPTITEVGGGIYEFDAVTSVTGMIDTGEAGAVNRYIFMRPATNNCFPVYNSSGAPQTGLSPTMTRSVAATAAPLSAIAISELGDGVYGFAYPNPTEEQIADIDTGGDAPPYLCLSIGLSASSSPTIDNITPTPGNTLATRFTPVQFDVVDLVGISLVLVSVTYASRKTRHVVYDGSAFTPDFEQSSTVTDIANGQQFSVLPQAGWQDSIDEFFVYAVDSDGNVEALP